MTDPKWKYIIEVISKDLSKDVYVFCENKKEVDMTYEQLKSYKIKYKAETYSIH